MKRPTRASLAGSAYLDLQNRASRERRGTQELLTLYVVERWLARLSASASLFRPGTQPDLNLLRTTTRAGYLQSGGAHPAGASGGVKHSLCRRPRSGSPRDSGKRPNAYS